jgi:dTDP-4-dehydrorhamnose reductase
MVRPIVVVGAAGQVGRELIALHEPGRFPIIGLTRQQLDIADEACVRETIAALKPSSVVNAAAYTAVDPAESERDVAFAINRDGARNLAVACADQKIPLLHISTDYVFDGCKPDPYLEDDSVAPLGVYGASKLAGEEAIRETLDRHIILRTAWVYAAHGTNFLRTILRLARERSELRIVDDQRGCPTPAGSIAAAIAAIVASCEGGGAWGTYHFCGAPPTTWFGFAQAVIEAAAPCLPRLPRIVPITTADYPTAATRPQNSVLDCRKISATFGVGQPDWQCITPSLVGILLSAG